MSDFGSRLKEERERLGLSQQAFAKECGVGKTAQYTYEKGERDPSVSYLEAAEKLGVDTSYVVTGVRAGKDGAYARAKSRLLYTIEMLLGLEREQLDPLCQEVVELSAQIGTEKIVDFGPWIEKVMAWLATATKPDHCLDIKLFTQVISAVEAHLGRVEVSLSPDKKAQVIMMLYRAFKAGGVVDNRMVGEAVALAAS